MLWRLGVENGVVAWEMIGKKVTLPSFFFFFQPVIVILWVPKMVVAAIPMMILD